MRIRSIKWKTDDWRVKRATGERITLMGGIVVFVQDGFWKVRWAR